MSQAPRALAQHLLVTLTTHGCGQPNPVPDLLPIASAAGMGFHGDPRWGVPVPWGQGLSHHGSDPDQKASRR